MILSSLERLRFAFGFIAYRFLLNSLLEIVFKEFKFEFCIYRNLVLSFRSFILEWRILWMIHISECFIFDFKLCFLAVYLAIVPIEMHSQFYMFNSHRKDVMADQRRQSGLKSGGSWIRIKKFRFSRKMFEKFRFFQAISQTKKLIFDSFRWFHKKLRFFKANFRILIFEAIFKKFRFSRKISKQFRFFQAISQRNRFSGQISEKFRFLSCNFTNRFDFSRQVSEEFRFLRQF